MLGPQLYLPNRKGLSRLYLPKEPVPPGVSRCIANTFSLAARETQQWTWTAQSALLLLTITGYDPDAAGFQVQFTHSFPGGSKRLSNKQLPAALLIGTAGTWSLRRPYLVDAGDSLKVEVKNLSAAAVPFLQVALFGVEPAGPAGDAA